MLFRETDTDKVRAFNAAMRCEVNHDRYINPYVKKDLRQIVGELRMGQAVHYANDTLFYLHDVLVYCLEQTGPAKVYFSTYAIKEFQARIVTRMRKENSITYLHALLDDRNAVHDQDAVQLLSKSCDVFGFNRTHSKLIAIRNDNWGISIVTSANMTNNTRLDVGVITCNAQVTDARIEWIIKNTKHGIK